MTEAQPQPDVVVVVDPQLPSVAAVRRLLPSITVITDVGATATVPIAVLTLARARALLTVTPSTTTVIVHAHRHERDATLDLYGLGAAMVLIDAPAEELAARVRALVRHLRQLHPAAQWRPS